MKKKGERKKKPKFKRTPSPSKEWPVLGRYMTEDGLSIMVYKAGYAEGAGRGPEVKPSR